MSVPASSHPVWQRLASGALDRLGTSNLGIQLMATRMRRSPDPVASKAAEIHGFFLKWERTLAAEIAQLSHL